MHSTKMNFRLMTLVFTLCLAMIKPLSAIEAAEPALFESYRILVHNNENGDISLSVDKGVTWQNIGMVTKAATKVNKNGFPRSTQAEDQTVCEIAADRVLLKVSQNYEDERYRYGQGTLFGLLAVEAAELQKREGNDPSMIYTNIPAGSLIFGKYAPLLGNRFYVVDEGKLAFPTPDFVPQKGDMFVIVVETYPQLIRDIVFENRFGGQVVAHYANGDSMIVAEVLRPVEGIGRFIGTEFLGPGQVRQTHGSAVGISTSRKVTKRVRSLDDYRGGFQIVTSEHIYDPQLIPARTSSQWMVIGPSCDNPNNFVDLQYPLFSNFVKPGMPVQVRIDNMDWEPFPEMTGSRDDAFLPRPLTDYFEARYVRQGITHFRLVNPDVN